MQSNLATTTGFYAGVNQPASAPGSMFMWAPLFVLSAGVLVLVVVLAYLARAEQRDTADSTRSFFD